MTITVLGTGLMGSAISQRFLARGRTLLVYNRTRSKTKTLIDQGAFHATSAEEAISQADRVLFTLTDHKAIEEILFSKKGRALRGKIIIQMGTIGSEESKTLNKRVKRCGGSYCECPVLGSVKEALSGKLFLMFGGTKAQFSQLRPLLKDLDPQSRYIGKVGQAAVLKLAFNHLIAAHAVSFSVSLGLIRRSAIDVDIFMEILRKSSLYAPMFDKKLPLWLAHHYTPVNFPVKHLLKDIDLILREVKRRKIASEEVAAIRRLLAESVKKGYKDLDYSAVFETISS